MTWDEKVEHVNPWGEKVEHVNPWSEKVECINSLVSVWCSGEGY